MVSKSFDPYSGGSKFDRAFGPDDLNELQRVFDDCLRECGVSRHSEAAEALGGAIIRLYSQGQRNLLAIKEEILDSFKISGKPSPIT